MQLEVAWGRPDPHLQRLLRPYCGYVERTGGRTVRPELPHPNVTLILSFGPKVEFPELGFTRGSFVAGLDPKPVTTAHEGLQQGVELNLSPLLASMVLGVPAGAIAGDVVELEDVLGQEGRELPERLHAAPGWPERFALADGWLLDRMARATRPADAVLATWTAILRSGGRASIGDLARDSGWSRRHLSQRFTDDIGISPKTFARIVRFTRARELIAAGTQTLGEVALNAGYYDQAHLNRDFREFAGAPPTQLPFVQDELTAAV